MLGLVVQPSCLAPQTQVLRYHSVGSTCSGAGSGPRLAIGDADQDVIRAGLGVFGEHIEVAIPVEDAGVAQLEFGLALAPAAVLLDEAGRKGTRPAGYL